MYLGLIDGSFVPHNLISTQYSPVPLLKFQMARRRKIITAFGSKTGTQIYFSFNSEVPANELPPGSPKGPLWREIPVYREFCILLYSNVGQLSFSTVTVSSLHPLLICQFGKKLRKPVLAPLCLSVCLSASVTLTITTRIFQNSVSEPVREIPDFYRTCLFITMFCKYVIFVCSTRLFYSTNS